MPLGGVVDSSDCDKRSLREVQLQSLLKKQSIRMQQAEKQVKRRGREVSKGLVSVMYYIILSDGVMVNAIK